MKTTLMVPMSVICKLTDTVPADQVDIFNLSLLTKREKEVAGMIVQGLPNSEIAARLEISPKTLDIHRGNIKNKLGTRSSNHTAVVLLRSMLWEHTEQVDGPRTIRAVEENDGIDAEKSRPGSGGAGRDQPPAP